MARWRGQKARASARNAYLIPLASTRRKLRWQLRVPGKTPWVLRVYVGEAAKATFERTVRVACSRRGDCRLTFGCRHVGYSHLKAAGRPSERTLRHSERPSAVPSGKAPLRAAEKRKGAEMPESRFANLSAGDLAHHARIRRVSRDTRMLQRPRLEEPGRATGRDD